MLPAIKNEIKKGWANKKIYAFLVTIVIANLLPGLETLIGEVDFIINGQNLPLYMLNTFAVIILPIFVIVIVSDMISTEYTNGTLKLPLIQQVSRTNLLAAKLIALFIMIIAVLLIAMFTSYLMGTLFYGWGDIFIYEEVTSLTFTGVNRVVGSYLITSVPLFIFGIVVMLFSLIFDSSGAVIGISMGLHILFSFIGAVTELVNPYLITYYFNEVSPLIFDTGDMMQTLTAIIVMLVYGVVSFATCVLVFNKKDLVY